MQPRSPDDRLTSPQREPAPTHSPPAAQEDPPLLCTEHLTKQYGQFLALDDLNLELSQGEVFGLLGPNGSGKTTALRLIMGFLRPTRGRATILGHDCWYDSVAARQQIAYLPGELRLYESMTGRQIVHFLAELRGQHLGKEVDDLARTFDIDLERPLVQLSSGMKRKVALLQVLVSDAPLVIMDEPTNALDPSMRDELLRQVRRAQKRGQTILFSSHVLAEVEQVCDRIAILKKGNLAHIQKVAELREGRWVQAHFHGKVEPPPPLEGLHILDYHPDRVTLEYTGELSELMVWLGSQPLADLRLEPLGLKAIYLRYHGNMEQTHQEGDHDLPWPETMEQETEQVNGFTELTGGNS